MKKVVIIGQTLNKNFAHKISGGIQTVERLHVSIFLGQGWDVYFVAPSDSERFRYDENFHLMLLNTPSEEYYKDVTLSKHDKGALNREKANDMREIVQSVHPDLVINHSFSSSHVRLAAELSKSYPVMNFVHNTSDTAMDIGLIAKLKFYLEMTKNGSNVICVSGYQRDTWRTAIGKRIDSGSEHFAFINKQEVNEVYDLYCHPIFVHLVTMADHADVGDRFIVITRPDPIKNLHKLLELMDSGIDKFPLDIFIAHPGNLDDSEYYNKKLKSVIVNLKLNGWDVQMWQNAPRDDLLKALSIARGCFIPCPVEAAPVALLEAGSYGVPSIVFGKTRNGVLGHAALDLLRDVWLVDVSEPTEISAAALEKAVKCIPVDADSRKNLHDYTQKTHSFLQRNEDIMKLYETISSRYHTKKPKLMEF